MDSRIIYTTEPTRLWNEFSGAAQRGGALSHGTPPELAIEIDGARLYVTENEPTDDVPGAALGLGPGVREFVVDIHNMVPAERFLADVLDGLTAVVDDDHGSINAAAEYVSAIRVRGDG